MGRGLGLDPDSAKLCEVDRKPIRLYVDKTPQPTTGKTTYEEMNALLYSGKTTAEI
jgi:hypothetical protein